MMFQLVFIACLAATARADTKLSVPVNGHEVPVTDVGTFDTTPTTRGGDITVSKPDQTFSQSGDGIHNADGVQDGKPVAETSVSEPTLENSISEAAGRRLLTIKANMGRKILAGLELSGDGVSAGNDVVGEEANAYGQGNAGEPLPSLSDTHIRPHGVDETTTVDGQDTSGGAGFNPDCVGEVEGYNEGKACTFANGK